MLDAGGPKQPAQGAAEATMGEARPEETLLPMRDLVLFRERRGVCRDPERRPAPRRPPAARRQGLAQRPVEDDLQRPSWQAQVDRDALYEAVACAILPAVLNSAHGRARHRPSARRSRHARSLIQEGQMPNKPRLESATGSPGLGSRRYQRYCAAFARVLQAQHDGYFLEGIAILDSLISDRLASRIEHVNGTPVSESLSCGQLCKDLLSSIEKDPAFQDKVKEIQSWVEGRNKAIHAMAKALKTEYDKTFTDILLSHASVLSSGIKHLRSFDALDIADRKRNGYTEGTATEPSAFDPPTPEGPSRP